MYEFHGEENMDMEERQRLIDEITKCTSIHWNFRDLNTLPKELEEYGKRLKYIYLSHNTLKRVPMWVTKMENLTEINVGYNGLECLPANIGQLKNLTKLTATGNKLKSLPLSLHDLKHLQVLNLSENEITFINEDIGKNVKLEVLTMDNNCLKTLPAGISKCTQLWDLSLNNNLITHLPVDLTMMAKLKYVAVQNNKLKCLPAIPFAKGFEKILYGGNHETLTDIPLLMLYMDGMNNGTILYGNQLENETMFDPANGNYAEYPRYEIQFNEDGTYETVFPAVRSLYNLILDSIQFKIDNILRSHRDPVYQEEQRNKIPKPILEDVKRPHAICYCGCRKMLYNKAVVYYFPSTFVVEDYRPYHMNPLQQFIAYFHPDHIPY